MGALDRRDFLGLSLAGLAGVSVGATAWAAKPKIITTPAPKPATPSLSNLLTPAPTVTVTSDPYDTLFLTWQRDPTTTMTIQWVGAPLAGGAPQIEYAPLKHVGPWTPVATKTKAYHPLVDWKVFRAEVTQLTPGTEYQFRIGKQNRVYRFRTMPAKATDSFQFVSGGDCGVNTHVVANNLLAARQDPMFVLIGGDLAYDNGHDVRSNLGFLRNYSKTMVDTSGRMVPLVVCIGNHEVKKGYGAQRSDGPLFFSLHDGLYAERSYATLDFGDYLSLVLLDSGHVAPIGGEQAAWLDKSLAERVERPHLIVANHVPAYPSYRKADTVGTKLGTGDLNRTEWAPLFEQHNVDVVLEHHDHTFKRTHPIKDGLVDKHGIIYLGDGSWGKLRAPQAAEARPYLASVGGSYHLTVHRLEGERRFHLALAEGGGVVDILMTEKRLRRPMGKG